MNPTLYYVWVEDTCDNVTSNPEEAQKWASEFIADGREGVAIYDSDGELYQTFKEKSDGQQI